jgi:hypothetical protein
MAARSVPVEGPVGLKSALRNLIMINQANKIRRVLSLQRYLERPGRVKLRLRNEKARRDFNKGVRRLFDLVSEAVERDIKSLCVNMLETYAIMNVPHRT